MNSLIILCKRNIKIYFKDKGLFFCSLITPFILLVLYVTFLKNVYETSFLTAIESINIDVPKELINSFVGGQLVSSLLSVTCITVTFCSNLIMIKDKTSGAINDFKISPVKFKIVGLSYFLATLFSTLIINFFCHDYLFHLFSLYRMVFIFYQHNKNYNKYNFTHNIWYCLILLH